VSLDHHTALVLLGLLVAATAMLALAPAMRIPYPILLVLGGLALGLVPGVSNVRLPPALVLVAVLPPLLYSEALFTSLRELRANARSISQLAVGLVLLTTVVVAAVAHAYLQLSWSTAFVLGAIVAPTDATAAASIARRLGVPRRIVTIVQGESLINDGVALVAYKSAVAAVVTGSFSLWHAGLSFIVNVAGGVAVGLAVGYVVRHVRRRLDDPPVEITISLLTGYLAYLPAELLGVSGVLAAATVGVYVGWYAPELSSPQQRLQAAAVWEIVVFLLNALLFVLIGLQFPAVLSGLGATSTGKLVAYAVVVAGTVVVTRSVWIFAAARLPPLPSQRVRARGSHDRWQEEAVVSWMGMRGAVSLAMALALPSATDGGTPFPGRDLIVFLTFAVILATLVLQGLSLPFVIRAFELEDDRSAEEEELKARLHAADAAMARLEELLDMEQVSPEEAEDVRRLYASRRDRFRSLLEGAAEPSTDAVLTANPRLRRELLQAERRALLEFRRAGEIDDAVMRRILRDLDLEEVQLQV
jgi:CPA1 family monovalent cation:H+ antiporter